MCRSVPQIDAAWTRTRTSPSPGEGVGTSCNSAPGASAVFRSARIVAAIVDPSLHPWEPRAVGTRPSRTRTKEAPVMRLRLVAAAVAIGIATAACANSSTVTKPAGGLDHATGPTDLVLRVQTGGGF